MNETRRDDTTRPEPAADAVEQVHKAICGALVMMGYSPIEFVVDGAMTAMARAALQAAIAAFEQALLSDEVVEAARDAIEAEVYAASHPGGRYSEEGLARAALQAALAAAKGTEGSD